MSYINMTRLMHAHLRIGSYVRGQVYPAQATYRIACVRCVHMGGLHFTII
jgi:hypothetical protein